MIAALEHLDAQLRSIIITDVCHRRPPIDDVIPLLSHALNDASDDVRSAAGLGLSHLGRHLTADDARRVEEHIPGSPHELSLRLLVLGYYFLGQQESQSACDARHQHIFWLIRHAPELNAAGSPEASIHGPQRHAYEEAKKLWLEQIESHPENTRILGNAASFFLIRDSQLSETTLKKARDLEPGNADWSERLGRLYSLVSREYFKLCAKFWQLGSDRLTEWARQVQAGETPAFGANLRY